MLSRRRCLVVLAALPGWGCGEKKKPTRDCSMPVDEASKALRASLKYVEASPNPDQRCDNCLHYMANQFRDCGGCQQFSGPVRPAGHCTAWAPLKRAPR